MNNLIDVHVQIAADASAINRVVTSLLIVPEGV